MYGNGRFDMTGGITMGKRPWTNTFDMLQRRELDVAYTPVTMSSSMLDVVDFTVPAVEMRYCHVYRYNSVQ
jgi:hypothetical protein